MMTKMRKFQRGRQVEALESRNLLAGDVSVHVLDGNLLVDGDSEGNQIAIHSGELPGQVYVTGLSLAGNDTTVNGMTGRVLFEGVRHNIRVGLGDGNDGLALGRLHTRGQVTIGMGAGNDHLTVGKANGVHIGGSLAVELGDGNDYLAAWRTHVGDSLFVDSGKGDDRIRLTNIGAARGMAVHGGEDRDWISAERVRAQSLLVAAGDGEDRVAVVGAVLGNLMVELGSGDDGLALGHNTAFGTVVLHGGDGEDSLTSLGNNRWRDPVIRDFEHIHLPSAIPSALDNWQPLAPTSELDAGHAAESAMAFS